MNNSIRTAKQRAYFHSLEKKRLECQLRLDKVKFDYVLGKVIGEKKAFVRNYSFLFDKPRLQIVTKGNLFKANKVKRIDNTINEGNFFEPQIENQSFNNYKKKMFKKRLFEEIYRKQIIPDRLGMKVYHDNNNNKINITKKDQSASTSCEPIPSSKLPPIIKNLFK